MNHNETAAAENNLHVQSDNNSTMKTMPQNGTADSFNTSVSDSEVSPIHDGESSVLWNSTNITNSSNPFGNNNNATQHDGGNLTNYDHMSDPFWDFLENWNGSSKFWDGYAFGGQDSSTTDNSNNNATTITADTVSSNAVDGPTTWEGYIVGIFCLGTAMLFILFPAWYMDRRRHLEFVGSRERREARSLRRRRRRWNRRRRRQQRFYWASTMAGSGMMMGDGSLRGQDDLVDDDAPNLLTKEYILNMLVTRPIQASDLCIEDQEPEEIPSLKNVVSDKTDDTATISTNKDQDMKDDDDDDDDDDDESYDLEEDSSIDDDDADCCAICLRGYKVGDEICYPIPRPCPHDFHRTCLVPWLLKQNVCPCCRVQYLPLPPESTRETLPEENELVETIVEAFMPGVDDGHSSFPDLVENGAQSTLESQDENYVGERESESSSSDQTTETQDDIDSAALTPLEDPLPSPDVCENVAENIHQTNGEGPIDEIDCGAESSDPEPAVEGLDTTARSDHERSLSLAICNSEEENNDANNSEAGDEVGSVVSTDVDLEAQTQLITTSSSCNEEDARSLDRDTDHGVPTMEQQTEQDDTTSVTNVAPGTTDEIIVRQVSSSDDENSLISA